MADVIYFPSKDERLRYVRTQLATNPKWAIRALTVVYQGQTSQEQSCERTVELNGVGFTAFDAEILTSFAQQVERWDASRYPSPLSPKQMALLHKRIVKYAGQLLARTCLADTLRIKE